MPVDVSGLITQIEERARLTMATAGPMVAVRLKDDHRAPRETGELVSMIKATGRVEVSGTVYRTQVAAPVIQAATTNYGARPHVIRPRRPGGVLAFNWPKAGGTVFLRSVNHPGNRAMNWWDPAVADAFRIALPQAARASGLA